MGLRTARGDGFMGPPSSPREVLVCRLLCIKPVMVVKPSTGSS